MRRCYADGGYLGEPEWMGRVLAETGRRLALLGEWGYYFPHDPVAAPEWMPADGLRSRQQNGSMARFPAAATARSWI